MRLIINADDLGIDVSRNRGILAAVDAGVVKSASVIVRQGGWEHAVEEIKKRPTLGVGLHFNLTAGKAFVKGHKTLVDGEGNFFDKFTLLSKVLARTIDPKEAEREFKAQWKIFLSAGIKPSHVDGHNHVHLFPGIAEGFFRGVPRGTWVRLPWHKKFPPLDPQGEDPKKIYTDLSFLTGALNYWCVKAREIWGQHFQYVEDFGGTTLSDEPTLKEFQSEVKRLNGEICELMCHPGGEADEQSVRFSHLPARRKERDILLSCEFQEFLKEAHVEIISYKDLRRLR